MRSVLLLIALTFLANLAFSQYVYTIKADSVKITNCDSAELILENHTQNVPGFLFNTGNGRTVFQRGALKLNDSAYLIGADTLKINPNSWIQGGNTFGNTGVLGTLDNNAVDFYTNNQQRVRLTSGGNFIIGSTTDANFPFQVVGTNGSKGIYMDPNLSLSSDAIKIGGLINSGDGQNSIISAETAGTWYNILEARQGYIGIGYGAPTGWEVAAPAIRLYPNALINISSPGIVYGATGGPFNASSLITTVSNTNEWTTGATGYPNGQNYYYFGTVLGTATTGNKRAPLYMGADQLKFSTGPGSDVFAGMFSENGNLLLGSTTDNGTSKLQVTGNVTTTGAVQFAGLTSDSSQTNVVVSDPGGNLYLRSVASLAANDVIRSSLTVNGPIKAMRLTLSPSDWPDFVFDSAYRLPSLPSVESYILRQHHLPGIPSAEEVEKNGADIGANQAAVLKKIEELTLYSIAQEKRFEEQNKKLEMQAESINALQQQIVELRKLLLNKPGK
jgi:hypothetical protein